jgi:UDP-N-acetylmuramate-alanine ligase
MPLAWTPRSEDGARFLAQRARPGDRILTIGAGDVDVEAPRLLDLLG